MCPRTSWSRRSSSISEAEGAGPARTRARGAGRFARLAILLALGGALIRSAPPVWAQKMPVLPPMQGHGVGNLAYDFTLKDLEGQVYSLKALRGKRVVQVVFWATWCGPCVEEIPQLREIYTKYHARGLEVFGVAVNMNQTPDGVRAFARQYEMNYPVLWDSGDKVMDRYRVSSIPRNFLIGKDGVIRYAGTGLPQGYDGLVERLLADEGPARTAAR